MIVGAGRSVFEPKRSKGIFNGMIYVEGCIDTLWCRMTPDHDISNPSKLKEEIQAPGWVTQIKASLQTDPTKCILCRVSHVGMCCSLMERILLTVSDYRQGQ